MLIWQRRKKRERDRKTLLGYEKRLRAEKKAYVQAFSAFSETGRKNRALCIGECCLQAMEKLTELVNQQPPVAFIPGSLFWNLNEERVKDEDGEKGFKYTVIYHVTSEEPAYTEEQIREKLMEAAEKLHAETEELFRKEESKSE